MYFSSPLSYCLDVSSILQDFKRDHMKRQRDRIIRLLDEVSVDELADVLNAMLKAIDHDNVSMFEYYEWLWQHLTAPLEPGKMHYFSDEHCKRYSLKLLQIIEHIKLSAISKRREQSSQRLSQNDLNSIAMDASMPIPPTMISKRGRLSTLIHEA